MDSVTVEIKTTEFTAALLRLQQAVKEGIVAKEYGTLPVQARLLAERCQVITPPRDQAQGREAVTRDITGIFQPLAPRTFTSKSIRKIVRKDDRIAWNKVAKNLRKPSLKNTTAVPFTANVHEAQRISRGRVSRSRLRIVTLGPEGRKVRDYIQKIKGMVGWARAGWNSAILGLGGTIKQSWVARHDRGRGSLVLSLNSEKPSVYVSNNSSWAKDRQNEGERIIRDAIRYRARDMGTYLNRMMNLAAKKGTKS